LPVRTEYSLDHVRALVEGYQEFRSRVDTDRAGLNFLVQMADIDRVLALIPDAYWEVVLLHGLLGLSQRTVAELLNRRQSSISERYVNALQEIHAQINRRYHS
jgi:DNA-directed RNA polymerase specialized sigma24 family protein